MTVTTRRASRMGAIVLGIFAVALTGGMLGSVLSHAAPTRVDPTAAVQAKAISQAFHEASQRVLPAVVMIQKTVPAEEPTGGDNGNSDADSPSKKSPFDELFRDPMLRRFFEGIPSLPRGPEVSMGSGIVIESSGVVLTNHHVVAGGGVVRVRLHDGREFDAVGIKSDPRTDIAVLRIEGAGSLAPAELGDSDALQTGDWVLAVGAPFGLDETVTAGIISAKNRGLGIAAREEFLQTDAAINPGNSGGPLIDVEGRVVGINTVISSQSGGYQGVGFAVPIKLARWVADQLIQHGTVRRAYLGISVQAVTGELAEQLGIKPHQGVLVSEVLPNTPASEAGLKPGDVIVEFAGRKIQHSRDLQAAVEKSEIGGSAAVVIVRQGKEITMQVRVREQPADYGVSKAEKARPTESGKAQIKDLGLEVTALDREIAEQLGLSGVEGLLITAVKPGSPAELAGLRSSMVITDVDGKVVKTVDDFRTALAGRSLEKGLLLRVRTREGSRFVVVKAHRAAK